MYKYSYYSTLGEEKRKKKKRNAFFSLDTSNILIDLFK